MDFFEYKNGQLHAENVALTEIAEQYGSPTYVYSRATIERHYQVLTAAFGTQAHKICYSVKANSNLGVLNVLARLGCGFDIVSGGELTRVLRAGGQAKDVVFSGVGKSFTEITAALEAGIGCFNVESEAELRRISAIATKLNTQAPIALRVNPDVDPQTHPYISTGLQENKFGIDFRDALRVYQLAAELPGIAIIGIDCHIGSQLTDATPIADALDRVISLVEQLEAHDITVAHIDLGGGLGIRYRDETPPTPAEWVAVILKRLGSRKTSIHLEPGRSIVGNAGILLTKVEYIKQQPARNFVIIDAAMNDLLRPALYQGWHEILPVITNSNPSLTYDVVGPICETGDTLGKDRELSVVEGDLLAIRSTGAYGMVMASNYNTRCRPAEIMVDGDQAYVVRSRETYDDLLRGETLLP